MLAILKTETCLTVVMRTSTKPRKYDAKSGPKWIQAFSFLKQEKKGMIPDFWKA
jgi:hypothetical protein